MSRENLIEEIDKALGHCQDAYNAFNGRDITAAECAVSNIETVLEDLKDTLSKGDA